MTRRRLEDHLGCIGYFGFGTGWSMARRGSARVAGRQASESYCSGSCSIRAACWDAHRQRVRGLMPALCEEFDRILQECRGDGQAAVERFWLLHGSPEPALMVMVGNTEDGAAVGAGRPPKDRGAGTLAWPLAPRSRPAATDQPGPQEPESHPVSAPDSAPDNAPDNGAQRLTPAVVMATVAEHFGLTIADLTSTGRTAYLSTARQVAYRMLRQLGQHLQGRPMSLVDVSRFLGRVDHQAVLHGLRVIEQRRQDSPELAASIAAIEASLFGSGGR